MNAQQLHTDSVGAQRAIYGVALSLDAFLLNGIQYGVFQQPVFGDFLQTTARNLTTDLEHLQEQVEEASASQPEISDILANLHSQSQRLIERVIGLASFRTLALPQVRLAVSEIAPLRAECVRLLQELESRLRTRTPFYASRPEHSTASVEAFLSGLERAFVEEWNVSGRQG